MIGTTRYSVDHLEGGRNWHSNKYSEAATKREMHGFRLIRPTNQQMATPTGKWTDALTEDQLVLYFATLAEGAGAPERNLFLKSIVKARDLVNAYMEETKSEREAAGKRRERDADQEDANAARGTSTSIPRQNVNPVAVGAMQAKEASELAKSLEDKHAQVTMRNHMMPLIAVASDGSGHITHRTFPFLHKESATFADAVLTSAEATANLVGDHPYAMAAAAQIRDDHKGEGARSASKFGPDCRQLSPLVREIAHAMRMAPDTPEDRMDAASRYCIVVGGRTPNDQLAALALQCFERIEILRITVNVARGFNQWWFFADNKLIQELHEHLSEKISMLIRKPNLSAVDEVVKGPQSCTKLFQNRFVAISQNGPAPNAKKQMTHDTSVVCTFCRNLSLDYFHPAANCHVQLAAQKAAQDRINNANGYGRGFTRGTRGFRGGGGRGGGRGARGSWGRGATNATAAEEQ